MEKLISAIEIVGLKYTPPVKRIGHVPDETDCKDPVFIAESINNKEDYKYFDMYGNLFSIDEIDNSVNEKHRAIEQAKAFLKENGYFVDNLWCVDDVKLKYDCTDEQAQGVLYQSLTNEATMGQIQFSIDEFAGLENLSKYPPKTYAISGYWKDSKEEFEDYIVSEAEEENEEQDDESIFHYGFDEAAIKNHIELGDKTWLEFVITSYFPL